MDQEYRIDLGEVRRNIERVEVAVLYFPYFRQTLLLDTRANAEAGPMACIRPMVNSVEERMQDLRALRPRFGRPESMTMIPWPRRVAGLAESGVWEMIAARLRAVGDDALGDELDRHYRALLTLEWQEYRRAIEGIGYKTIWEGRG